MRILLLPIMMITAIKSYACDCNYQSFLYMASHSDLCVKAEVIKVKEDHYQLYPSTEKIWVRVIENFNSKIDSDTLEIKALSWLNTCTTSRINGFQTGDVYYLNLFHTNKQLRLGTCGESILKIHPDGSINSSIDSLTSEIEIDSKLDEVFLNKTDQYNYSAIEFDDYLANGNPIGENREYFENGNLKSIYTIDSTGIQGTGMYFSEDNRNVLIRNYKNNRLEGATNFYYIKKNFITKFEYKNGILQSINQKLVKSYPYKNGCLDGTINIYKGRKIIEKQFYESGSYKGCEGCEEF